MGDKGQYTVDSLPFFMKTVSRLAITNDYPSYMSFPKEFADQQAGKMNRDVILKTSGNKWSVKVGPVKNGTIAFRGVGWVRFVKDNNLAVGDQVTFTMLSGTLFSVKIVRAGPVVKVKEEPVEESVPVFKPEEQNGPVDEVDLSSPQVAKGLGAPPTPAPAPTPTTSAPAPTPTTSAPAPAQTPTSPAPTPAPTPTPTPTPPPPPPPSQPPTAKENEGETGPGNVENVNITIENSKSPDNGTPMAGTRKRAAQLPSEETPPAQRMRKKVSATPGSATPTPECGFNSRHYATRSSTGAKAKEAVSKDEAIATRTRSAAKQTPSHAEGKEAGRQDTDLPREGESLPKVSETEDKHLGTEQDPFVLDISGANKQGGIHILMKTENNKAYKLFISASAVEEVGRAAAGPERPLETPAGPERPSETTPVPDRPSETPAERPLRSPPPSERPVEIPASKSKTPLPPNGPLPRITVPIRTTTVQSYSRLAIDKGFAEKWLPHESCPIKVVDAQGTIWWMNWAENEKRLKTEGWERLVKHYSLEIGDVCLLEVLDSTNFKISFTDSTGKTKSLS